MSWEERLPARSGDVRGIMDPLRAVGKGEGTRASEMRQCVVRVWIRVTERSREELERVRGPKS